MHLPQTKAKIEDAFGKRSTINWGLFISHVCEVFLFICNELFPSIKVESNGDEEKIFWLKDNEWKHDLFVVN